MILKIINTQTPFFVVSTTDNYKRKKEHGKWMICGTKYIEQRETWKIHLTNSSLARRKISHIERHFLQSRLNSDQAT